MSQNWIIGKFSGNSLMYREKPGFWHIFPFRNPKMENEPWHMLVITCLDPPDVLLESLKPQKIGPSVAIFPRKNDDNLMDVGWISVQARAATGCLDMFGLRISATLCKNHENLAGPASILSKLNFAASCGCQVAKVIFAHASSGLCLVDSVVAVPCFPHFSTACICQAPSNEPAHFTNLLQAIHGIPCGNKA